MTMALETNLTCVYLCLPVHVLRVCACVPARSCVSLPIPSQEEEENHGPLGALKEKEKEKERGQEEGDKTESRGEICCWKEIERTGWRAKMRM